MKHLVSIALAAACVALTSNAALGQTREDQTVRAAAGVLDEIMAIPAKRIPQSLLADAQGLAIFPGVIKVGFVAGVRHGNGVLMLRDDDGAWTAPAFLSITGGSVGWQVGAQSTDVILVFKSRESIANMMKGKFTLGVDAAVAAGPVGRQAAAGTDVKLKAEILSYSRSRGLFAGVALDGSALQIDKNAGAVYYGATQTGQPTRTPESAIRLLQKVSRYTSGGDTVIEPPMPGPVEGPNPVAQTPINAELAARRRLADASLNLQRLMDARWRQYLALPGEVYGAGQPPTVDALDLALSHYETVAKTAAYRQLGQRAEFQTTLQLLRDYVRGRIATAGELQLPPPPSDPRLLPQQSPERLPTPRR